MKKVTVLIAELSPFWFISNSTERNDMMVLNYIGYDVKDHMDRNDI